MWGHFLPLPCSNIHDVYITSGARKAYACQAAMVGLYSGTAASAVCRMQHSRSFSPDVEVGPGDAGGASPLCEPSSAVAPPVNAT